MKKNAENYKYINLYISQFQIMLSFMTAKGYIKAPNAKQATNDL